MGREMGTSDRESDGVVRVIAPTAVLFLLLLLITVMSKGCENAEPTKREWYSMDGSGE